jgi:hypothetical protein
MHAMPEDAKSCGHCGALVLRTSPLVRLAYFYVLGGIAFIGSYAYLVDVETAKSLAFKWLAVGVALALIVYGRANRHASDRAGLVYLLGLALLVTMLVFGAWVIWRQGVAMPIMESLANG